MKKITLICLIIFSSCSAWAQYAPTSEYNTKTIKGWKVFINKELTEKDPELTEKVLQLLDHHLYNILRVVPDKALKHLKKINIWVEYNEPRYPCMCYHPSEDWLKDNDFNPEKAGGVEIANPENFMTWTITQPWMVLHEMAHGYHHQVLGYDNADIKDAYNKAVESKKYESVQHISGQSKKAYALNNDQEYFAEASEAYFGTNDYYPFVKSELREHDPMLFELLKKVWEN